MGRNRPNDHQSDKAVSSKNRAGDDETTKNTMASTWPDLVGDELAPRSNSVHGDFQRLPAESQERFDEGQRTPGVRRLGLLGSIALGAYTLAFVFGRIGQLMSLLAEHPFGVICGAGWLALQRIPFSLLAPMLMVVAVLNWDYFSVSDSRRK